MALPNIKSKFLDLLTQSHRGKHPTTTQKLDSSFDLPKNIEKPENSYTRNPRKLKTHSLSLVLSKDLLKLEQDLDYNEFQISKSDPFQEFNLYKSFFESLSQTLKFKDEKISRLLNRGIFGIERIVRKIKESKPEVQVIEKYSRAKAETQDFSGQANIEIKYPPNHSDPEIANIRDLPKALEKIKLSRISNHLEDLFDNLTNIQTDIPSPTSSPDLAPLDSVHPTRLINLNLTVIRETMTKHLQNPDVQQTYKRLGIEKAVQANLETKSTLLSALESIAKDKELDNFKLKSQNSINVKNKANLEAALIKGNNLNSILEKRVEEYEREIFQMRKAKNELEEKNKELEERAKKSDENLDKVLKELKNRKKTEENLKSLLVKKQKMLQSALDQLYYAQAMLKVADKKLPQIEKGYLNMLGEEFRYKDIDIIDLTSQAGIRRKVLRGVESELELRIDESEKSSYSEDEVPEIYADFIGADQARAVDMIFGNAGGLKLGRNPGKKTETDFREKDRDKEMTKGFLNKTKNRNYAEKNASFEARNEDINEDLNFNKTGENSIKGNNITYAKEDISKCTKNKANFSEPEKNKAKEIERSQGFLEREEYLKSSLKLNTETVDEQVTENKTKEPKNLENPKKISKIEKEGKQIKHLKKSDFFNQENIPTNHSEKKPAPKANKKNDYKLQATQSEFLPEATPNNLKPVSNSKFGKINKEIISSTFNSSLPSNSITASNSSELSQKPRISSKIKTGLLIESSRPNTKTPSFDQRDSEINKKEQIKTHTKESSLGPSNPEIQSYVPSSYQPLKYLEARARKEFSLSDQETNSIYHSEADWINSLNKEQQMSIFKYHEKLNYLKKANIENCSKSVQCLLLDDSCSFDNERFEKDKVKFKDILGKVFSNINEIDYYPFYFKMRVQRALAGHKSECSEYCEHLTRVINLKKKTRGIPYPLKIVKI